MLNPVLILIVLAAALFIWNVITFMMYAVDKRKAGKGQWRIKESTLILVAFLMGGLGAFLGMTMLRHKTKHLQFRILLPVALVINVLVIIAVCWTGILN